MEWYNICSKFARHWQCCNLTDSVNRCNTSWWQGTCIPGITGQYTTGDALVLCAMVISTYIIDYVGYACWSSAKPEFLKPFLSQCLEIIWHNIVILTTDVLLKCQWVMYRTIYLTEKSSQLLLLQLLGFNRPLVATAFCVATQPCSERQS